MAKIIELVKNIFTTKQKPDTDDEMNSQIERTYRVISANIERAETYFELSLCDILIQNRLIEQYPFNYKVKACLFALRIQLQVKERLIKKQQPNLNNHLLTNN